MSEKTRTDVQVDLSDFAQILQVGCLLWGVDRHSKDCAKSFEGNHEIGIPLNIAMIYGSTNEPGHSVTMTDDEGNHPLTPQMIVMKIAKLQALIKAASYVLN